MGLVTKVVDDERWVKQAQEGLDKVLEIIDKRASCSKEYALGVMEYAFEHGELYAEDSAQLAEMFHMDLL